MRAQLLLLVVLKGIKVKSLAWVRNIDCSSRGWNVEFGAACNHKLVLELAW
jgi:hypothetical protein